AITVVFSVILVVFMVVGHKVVERETVVACHEVDTLLRFAFLVSINLRAANHPVGYATRRAGFTAKEAAHVVSELSVPLLPAVSDEAAYLVEASRVPCFSNDLSAGEGRV